MAPCIRRRAAGAEPKAPPARARERLAARASARAGAARGRHARRGPDLGRTEHLAGGEAIARGFRDGATLTFVR